MKTSAALQSLHRLILRRNRSLEQGGQARDRLTNHGSAVDARNQQHAASRRDVTATVGPFVLVALGLLAGRTDLQPNHRASRMATGPEQTIR